MLFSLTCAIGITNATASQEPEYFQISISANPHSLQPRLSAERTDTQVKWFDDNPSGKSHTEWEIGAFLPYGYALFLRHKSIEGKHVGEASKYQCFMFFCSWIGSSIVSSLSTSDQVSYTIDSNQIWLQKAPLNIVPNLAFRLGVNVIDAELNVSGAGSQQTEKGLVPLPFAGLSYKRDLPWNLSLWADYNYMKYQNKKAGVIFVDTMFGIKKQLSRNLSISVGQKRFLLDTWYQKESVSATWKIPQNTPFLMLTVQY